MNHLPGVPGIPYQYKARLKRVVDGDTVDLAVDVGYHITVTTRFRLLDLDTPEIRGEQREEGLSAKMYLEELLCGHEIVVHSHKTGKYGRWLAQLYVGDQDINALMRQWCREALEEDA